KDSKKSHRVCQEKQRAFKRQKTFKPTIVEDQITPRDSDLIKHGMGKGLMAVRRLASQPARSHGMGKGFMAIQRLTQLGAVNLPTCTENDHGVCAQPPLSKSKKPTTQGKKNPRRKQPVKRKVVNKVPEKKSSTRSKKVRCEQVDKVKQRRSGVCEIALVGGRIEEDPSQYAMLVDDEELELRELQETSNHATSCAHCAANRLHGCSLCKDFDRFKGGSRQSYFVGDVYVGTHSSPQLCKKLFKIFHFISTYAAIIRTQSFTFDELAQAFIDKDSLLLGKINISLLELLLTGVEKELDIEYVSHINKNWKYRALIQSIVGLKLATTSDKVEELISSMLSNNTLTIHSEIDESHPGEMWLLGLIEGEYSDLYIDEKLNALLALVDLLKAGSSIQKEEPVSSSAQYVPNIYQIGNGGMKISELATSSSIVGLKLATTSDKVEELISSMLSSDITLFEKISSSSYRLRSNSIKLAEDDQSDLEDCGSVDDDPNDISNSHNMDDSDDGSGALIAHKHGQTNSNKFKDNTLTIHSEIDESHPGEMWLLGLIEGEYSDLNIDEKLNALLALVDLLKAGSSIQMEEPVSLSAQYVPNIYQIGSGAKIKRSTAKQQRIFMPLENNCRQIIISGESDTMQDVQPVDSSAVISVIQEKGGEKDLTSVEDVDDLHPMQSIYLGSDRRMKQPLHMQPWDSSPQLCKKLFKIFHFISTYAAIIRTQSFTFDELAQAFIDKDSLLLGKINISLLELLLTGVEKELDIEYVSHINKNWKYRALIQSIVGLKLATTSDKVEELISSMLSSEYSDLYIDEKLNALLALVDLLKAGSSIQKEALTSLLSVLDRRGRRECHLLSSLEKREAFLSEAMSSIHNDVRVGQPTISGDSERSVSRDDSSSAVSDVDNLLGLNCMHHDNLASTSDVIAPIGNR
nr:DDT domain-containing protein [Tanacetum cinerariifolium]